MLSEMTVWLLMVLAIVGVMLAIVSLIRKEQRRRRELALLILQRDRIWRRAQAEREREYWEEFRARQTQPMPRLRPLDRTRARTTPMLD